MNATWLSRHSLYVRKLFTLKKHFKFEVDSNAVEIEVLRNKNEALIVVTISVSFALRNSIVEENLKQPPKIAQ